MILLICIILIFVIETEWSPRLGTADDKLLLWYGKKNRKFIIIW